MDQLLSYLSSKSPWADNEPSDVYPTVVKLWSKSVSDGLTRTDHEDIRQGDVSSANAQDDEKASCVSHFVIAFEPKKDSDSASVADGTTKIDLTNMAPPSSLKNIVDDFQLNMAYQFAKSSISGIAVLPPDPESPEMQSYALVNHPKLSAIWSSSKTGATPTRAVILAGGDEYLRLMEVFKKPWPCDAAAHPMFPGFLCGLILSLSVDEAHDDFKTDLRKVEASTGFHQFSNNRERPAKESYEELGAKVSGYSTKLAGISRKIRIGLELQEFILTHARDQRDNGKGVDLIKQYANLLNDRLKMQRLDNDYVMERAKVQQMAVSCLSYK